MDDEFEFLNFDDHPVDHHGTLFQENYNQNNLQNTNFNEINEDELMDNAFDLDESDLDYDDDNDEDDEEEEEIELNEASINMAKEMDHLSDESLLELIAYNASYLEIIQKLIEKTDRAVLENMESMEMIQEQIAEEEIGVQIQAKVSLVPLDKPYFKDDFGMTAVSNNEAKELYKNHQLTTLLKEESSWSQNDLNKLRRGVRRSILKNINLQLKSRMNVLKDKIRFFSAANTDDDRKQWEEEIGSIKRKIEFNENLSDAEILTGDYSQVDWVEVAMHDLNGDKTPLQVKMKWCNEECPQINKRPWTEEEDKILKDNAAQTWTNWKFITHEMGTNRSEFQAMCRAKELILRTFKEPQLWTPEEDEKLLSIISNCRNTESIPWEKVSKLLGTRNAQQCKIRFQQTLVSNNHYGKWSEHEDIFLLDAINRFGPVDWDRIASFVPGRNERECRTRYLNQLDVKRDIQPWTPEDDELLLEAVNVVGRGYWSELSLLFPGRTPLDLRARYRGFVLNVYHGRKLTYETISAQTKYRMIRKDMTMTRFKELESTEYNDELHDRIYKRFGIGGYLIKNGEINKKMKEQLGELRIHLSGVYRKPTLIEEKRRNRFNKFISKLDPVVRENLSKITNKCEELRTMRDLNEKEFQELNDEERAKCLKKRNEEASEKLTKLMKSTVTIEESDRRLIARKKLPRVKIRRQYPKRRVTMDPKIAEQKMQEASLIKDVRKRYDVIRELPILPQIIQLLGLQEYQTKFNDGSLRRIQDLVLMENSNGKYYWATVREEIILNLLEDLNKCLYNSSMSKYENKWRLQSSKRCEEYFKKMLLFENLPPIIYSDPKSYPKLKDYRGLISNVMLPNRATLTALEQYRIKGRRICNRNAAIYFDELNLEGRHVFLNDPDKARLDVRLSKSVTNSNEYQKLRCQMFKMFFFPMLMEYGQRSNDYKAKLLSRIENEKKRIVMEKEFEENGSHSNVVFLHQNDSILLGPSTSKLNSIRPDVGIIDMDKKLTESVNAVVEMVSKGTTENDQQPTYNAPPKPPRIVNKRARKQQTESSSETEPKRRKNKKTNETPEDKGGLSIPESVEISQSEGMEVVVLHPSARDSAAIDAYRPRWVQQKLKNKDDNSGELTLADLLFVRGKRQRRARAGLYDLQHTEQILDTLRPTVLSQQQANQAQEAGTSQELDETIRIKQELVESNNENV